MSKYCALKVSSFVSLFALLLTGGCSAQTQTVNPAVVQPINAPLHVLEPFGVGSHWNEMKYYGLAKKAGIQWLRVDINWYHVQPDNENQWDWGPIDAAMDEAHKQGLKVLSIVSYTNKWASSDPTEAKDNKYAPLMKYDAAWQTFVDKSVARYKDRVQMWEIWNEPDHGNFLKVGPGSWAIEQFPNESSVMQKRLEYKHIADMALDRMKAHGVKVTTSGFARGGRSFDPGFVDWLKTQKDWFNQFDVVNYHSYGWPNFDRLVSTSDEFRKLAEDANMTVPLWITEHGITELDVPDDTTKSYLIKSYAVGLSQLDVEKLFWFRLTPGGDHMILIDAKGKPTAAYDAYSVLTRQWHEPVAIEPWISNEKRVRGALATLKSGKKVGIVWTDSATATHVNDLPMKVTSICNQDGQDIPVAENPLLSKEPLFVTFAPQ